MPKRTIKDIGFTPGQIEYLVAHSQEIYPPSDFDDEVQRYLDDEVQRYLDEWITPEAKNSRFD